MIIHNIKIINMVNFLQEPLINHIINEVKINKKEKLNLVGCLLKFILYYNDIEKWHDKLYRESTFKYLLKDKIRNINRKYNKEVISNYEDNEYPISPWNKRYLSFWQSLSIDLNNLKKNDNTIKLLGLNYIENKSNIVFSSSYYKLYINDKLKYHIANNIYKGNYTLKNYIYIPYNSSNKYLINLKGDKNEIDNFIVSIHLVEIMKWVCKDWYNILNEFVN